MLSCSREVFHILIQETRAWYREYRNAKKLDPKLYNIGDIVLARKEVKSNKKKGIVGKTTYKFTGSWRIIEKLH